MSAGLEELAEAYLDGSLDAAGAETLATALRRGGEAARLVRERIALAGLLGQVCDQTAPEAVERAIAERIDASGPGSATAFVTAVGRSLDRPGARRRQRRASWPLPLAVAAGLAIALAAGWLALAPGADPCRILAGTAAIERGGTALPEARELAAGDRLVARAALTLGYRDGTRLELASGSALRIAGDATGKRLRLDHGELQAEVARQADGRPLTIETPSAAVVVVGTRFTLAVDAERSRLDLHQGAVRFIRSRDGRSLALHAGQTASVAADAEFAVLPLAAAPAWRELFAADLAGWTMQHGRWSRSAGVVRGGDPQGGKARLLSDAAFQDLDLSCRLRLGSKPAEVQVGDYNWFFTVPAGSGDWIAIRLHQRGEELTCTADGVALQREAGDGRPARPGPLSFYVGAGGTLEITDARIATP